ncbi:sigma factor, partial [Priestia megaterium]|uniref:sigma factor n=1 Tax=Priestia megaterium TaxID=1404 RepID=UPI003100F182
LLRNPMNTVIEKQTKQLTDLSNEELVELYREEYNVTPLRILYSRNKQNLSTLSEDMLVVLLQNGYTDVKENLYDLVKVNKYNTSDEVLVIMSQDGIEDAKDIISVQYVDFVKRTVLQLKKRGRYNRGDDDDDLIQSGYIGFCKAIRDFKIEKKRPFKIFVQHVIKRHIDSIISRSGNNKLRTLNDAFSYHSPVSKNDSENTFEQLLKSEEYQPEHHLIVEETFWELWETLSETEKCVCWYYSEDYSYEEIGKIVFRDTHPTIEAQIKAVDNTMQRVKTKREDYIEMLKKSK